MSPEKGETLANGDHADKLYKDVMLSEISHSQDSKYSLCDSIDTQGVENS